MDVNAIDVTGAGEEGVELEVLAADNVKRVVHAGSDQSPWEISAFLELKTVWHPVGTCDGRAYRRRAASAALGLIRAGTGAES